MGLDNINSLEDLAKNLHKYLSDVNHYLMPYGYCASYHTCNKCPFGMVLFNHGGVDLRICELLFSLEHKLGKVVNTIEKGE